MLTQKYPQKYIQLLLVLLILVVALISLTMICLNRNSKPEIVQTQIEQANSTSLSDQQALSQQIKEIEDKREKDKNEMFTQEEVQSQIKEIEESRNADLKQPSQEEIAAQIKEIEEARK